jgi:hypothetical protein
MPDPTAPPKAPGGEGRGAVRALGDTVTSVDPFLGAQLFVGGAIALDVLLPDRLTPGPTWLLPSVEGALLVALVVVSPRPRWRMSDLRRRVAIGLIALVSATNIYSLVELCRYLLRGSHTTSGRELIFAGIQLWLTNVLLFALWYWELDQGGPFRRAVRTRTDQLPDFMFPQDVQRELSPASWSPGLIDYLYVSFTNATAFSPTDTMPLTQSAKLLMTAQALTSLLIVVLIVSRAVNILS